MQDFQVLFDHAERSALLDPVYAPYGKLGFPAPPGARPWIFANFVQSVDGIVSLLGADASGSDLAQSPEDRWLMDLLRAHADGILLGVGTLLAETRLQRPRPRGPVFRIMEPTLRELRQHLRGGAERNIFVTASGRLRLADYAVFDADAPVEAYVVTSPQGFQGLFAQTSSTHPHVKLLVAGTAAEVDLLAAVQLLRERQGVQYLLCEGGPRFYGSMLRQGLIDEKFLTVAPVEVGQQVAGPPAEGEPGLRPTIAFHEGFRKQDAVRWEWISCRRAGDQQFHRLRRKA